MKSWKVENVDSHWKAPFDSRLSLSVRQGRELIFVMIIRRWGWRGTVGTGRIGDKSFLSGLLLLVRRVLPIVLDLFLLELPLASIQLCHSCETCFEGLEGRKEEGRSLFFLLEVSAAIARLRSSWSSFFIFPTSTSFLPLPLFQQTMAASNTRVPLIFGTMTIGDEGKNGVSRIISHSEASKFEILLNRSNPLSPIFFLLGKNSISIRSTEHSRYLLQTWRERTWHCLRLRWRFYRSFSFKAQSQWILHRY